MRIALDCGARVALDRRGAGETRARPASPPHPIHKRMADMDDGGGDGESGDNDDSDADARDGAARGCGPRAGECWRGAPFGGAKPRARRGPATPRAARAPRAAWTRAAEAARTECPGCFPTCCGTLCARTL
jgi:hypothetical protein